MIAYIVAFTIECIKQMIVFIGIANYRFARPYKAMIAYGLSVLVFITVYLLNPDYLSVFSMLSIVVCSLAVKGKKRFLLGTLFYFCISFIDNLIIILLSKYIPNVLLVDERPDLFCLTNSLSILILAPIALIMQKYVFSRKNDLSDYNNNTNLLCLILILIGEVLSTLIIVPYRYPNDQLSIKSNYYLLGGICVFCAVFTLTAILLLYNNNSKTRYKRLTEINFKRIEIQEKYYKMLLKKEEETRRFRHDISNHILCLETLLKENDVDSAMEYLAQLRGKVEKVRPRIQTGNTLINAIVNDISAKYENVELDWKGTFPEKLRLSDIDVCTVFSNLFENAFSNAGGGSGDGKVNVQIKVLDKNAFVSISNSISKPVKKEKNRIITQKADKKNHGFGMMNVKNSLEKYGGKFDYSYTESEFFVDLTIPNAFQKSTG